MQYESYGKTYKSPVRGAICYAGDIHPNWQPKNVRTCVYSRYASFKKAVAAGFESNSLGMDR